MMAMPMQCLPTTIEVMDWWMVLTMSSHVDWLICYRLAFELVLQIRWLVIMGLCAGPSAFDGQRGAWRFNFARRRVDLLLDTGCISGQRTTKRHQSWTWKVWLVAVVINARHSHCVTSTRATTPPVFFLHSVIHFSPNWILPLFCLVRDVIALRHRRSLAGHLFSFHFQQ